MKRNLNTILLKYTTPYGWTTFQDYYCDHNLLVHTALSNNIKTKKIKTQSEQTITLLATIIKKKNENKTNN